MVVAEFVQCPGKTHGTLRTPCAEISVYPNSASLVDTPWTKNQAKRRGPPLQGAALQGVRRRSSAQAAEPAFAGDRVARARQAGYDGGKSALYSLIASVRPRRTRPLSDHDRVPGEIARHGFGQVDVRFREGGERTLTFFVSRLEYSRFVVASIVPDQSVETCVRTLAAHHAAMGGVPLLAAFDRPRPIGVRADDDGQVTEWDPAFAYAALELGVGVEVRARRGAERGPGNQPRQLAEARVLQDRDLRRRGRRRRDSWASGCATTTRGRRTRSWARRPRSCWPRSGNACGRSSCSRVISRCASPCWSARARRSSTKASRTRCRPRRSV